MMADIKICYGQSIGGMNNNRLPIGAKFLAHGGAAEVWLIDNPNPAVHKCVLKTIRLNLETLKKNYGSGDSSETVKLWEDFTRTFRSKVDQWRPLAHPNVARIFNLSEQLDLSVEYFACGTASQYLAEHQHNSISFQWNIIEDVLEGLSYLHSQNPPVVHGCIRMDKLFVDIHGRTKIGEFGLTSLLEDFEFFEPSISLAGQIRWMSPELLLANTVQPPVPTMASDVWALGCTLFEMMSGKVPYFRYKHDLRIRHEIVSKKFPGHFADCHSDGLPSYDFLEIWDLANLCWEWAPEQRQSIDELIRLVHWPRPTAIFEDETTLQQSQTTNRNYGFSSWVTLEGVKDTLFTPQPSLSQESLKTVGTSQLPLEASFPLASPVDDFISQTSLHEWPRAENVPLAIPTPSTKQRQYRPSGDRQPVACGYKDPITGVQCDEPFNRSVELRRHVRAVHVPAEALAVTTGQLSRSQATLLPADWKPGDDGVLRPKCVCGKEFSRLDALRRHWNGVGAEVIDGKCISCPSSIGKKKSDAGLK